MKKSFFALLSVALLAIAGVSEISAQENNNESTGIEQQRIGQWVITREYTVTRDDEDGMAEKSNVKYDISYGHGFDAHLPFYYMGFSGFLDGPLSMRVDDIEIDEAKSWEWGIYLPMDAVRLGSDHVGLGFAFGFGRTMYKFGSTNYFFTSRSAAGERTTQFAQLPTDTQYDETWFRYWTFKLPVQLEFQTSSDGFFFTVGPELEYRFSPASRGRQFGKRKETITNSISMHPLNVNLLTQVGYNNISLMAKASLMELFSGTSSISTPNDAKVWPISVCLGLTF